MKNLPDKIYLNFGEITNEEFEEDDYNEFCKLDEYAVTFCEDRVYNTDIEYVRKDAFIEKACEGIEHLLSGYIIRNFHFGDSYEMDTLIEDFKKYMEE